MKSSVWLLGGVLLSLVSTFGSFAQKSDPLKFTQKKIADYRRQIESKGEFETMEEYNARVKEAKKKISGLLPSAYRTPCTIQVATYDPDQEVFYTSATSGATSLAFNIKVARDEARRLKERSKNLKGTLLVGLDATGGVVPLAAEFNFEGKTYSYEDPGALIAWVPLVQSFELGDQVSDILLSPNGDRLFVVHKNDLQILDCNTGRLLQSFNADPSPILLTSLSNDGKLLATATPDEVKIWNLESPTTSKTIKVDSPPLTSLSFSGDSILATSSGYEILLWKLDSLGSPEQRYTPAYLTMSESERREKLTSLQNQYTEVKKELDKAIIIGRLGEDLERIQGELQLFSKRRLAHSEDILTISFESPSAKLLSVGVDGVLKVWDASALSEIRRTSVGRLKSYDNHTYVATNGKYLAYISEKYFNSVDLFSISDEKYIRTFSAVPPFALSSDGRLLATQATGLGFAPCFLYDCQTGTGYDLDGNPTNAVIFRFSFDGKVLACLHTGGHVNLWRVISRNLHPTGLSGADSKTGIHKVPLELDKNFPKESGVFIKKSENTSNGSGKHESREQIQEWQSELSNLQVDYDQRSREYERKKDILNENTKAAIEKELRQLRDRVEDLKKKIAGKN